MPIDCYGNDGTNGRAIEDVREWVQNLAHHPPQGPLVWVSSFDKSQGIANRQDANVCYSQIEYVPVHSGFVSAVRACYDDNQDITHDTNGADDCAQAQANGFDKFRLPEIGTFGHQSGRVRGIARIVDMIHCFSMVTGPLIHQVINQSSQSLRAIFPFNLKIKRTMVIFKQQEITDGGQEKGVLDG